MSLQNKAIQCALKVKVWGVSKTDKGESQKVVSANQAETGAAKVAKILVVDDKLKAIQTIANDARNNTHYHLSLPWLQSYRIIPQELVYRWENELSNKRAEFNAAVGDFIADYWDIVERQSARLGKLYNLSDYPNPAKVATAFELNYHVAPLSTAGDFRVSLSDELKSTLAEAYTKELRDAQAHTVSRFRKALTAFCDSQSDTRKRQNLSVYDDLAEFVKLAAALNVADDSTLTDLVKRTADILSNVRMQDLREKNQLAQTAVANVGDIINDLDAALEYAV